MSASLTKVPVTVLTGFLGAGKTTLLNHILSMNHGLRAAVLVNDFGALNIDAKLVVGVEGETVSLANGCICCTMRDDLLTETLRLLARPDRPEYIVVEASGVSDPKLIAETFLSAELEFAARLDSIVAVVDSEQLLDLRGESLALALDQIRVADIVVLNKVDLVPQVKLQAVRARVAELVPGARILSAVYAQVPLALVLDIGTEEAPRRSERPTGTCRVHGTDCDQEGCGAASHRHGYATWHWSSERPVSLARFREVIGSLPTSVCRAKGILQVQEYPMYSVAFQLTGRRSSLSATGFWGDAAPHSDLVMIAAGDGAEFDPLGERLDACTEEREDSPRLVEWRKNPLSS